MLFDSSHISRLSKMRSRHTMSAGNEEEIRPLSTSSKSSGQLLDGDLNSYGTNQDRHQRGPEIRVLKVRYSIVTRHESCQVARTRLSCCYHSPTYSAVLRQDKNMCTRRVNYTEIVDCTLYVTVKVSKFDSRKCQFKYEYKRTYPVYIAQRHASKLFPQQ